MRPVAKCKELRRGGFIVGSIRKKKVKDELREFHWMDSVKEFRANTGWRSVKKQKASAGGQLPLFGGQETIEHLNIPANKRKKKVRNDREEMDI